MIGQDGALPESIGLCCSGGGYRASAFHLGMLGYLDRVGLLDRVAILSTVSGGTFTGVKYALALADGVPFPAFYAGFAEELAASRLFTGILSRLGGGDAPPGVPSGRRNLVTSAAQSYAESLFAGADGRPRTFGELFDRGTGPIAELIFNTTDFRRGLAFRFQKSASEGWIGNFGLRVPEEAARAVRLADVVAASSCFPGGFEPIDFPGDFAWPGGAVPDLPVATNPAAPEARLPGQSTPLMDGGVYDNNGLESLLLAADRRARADDGARGPDWPGIDLVIVSDTDPSKAALFRMEEGPGRSVMRLPGWLGRRDPTVGTLERLLFAVQAVGLFSAVSGVLTMAGLAIAGGLGRFLLGAAVLGPGAALGASAFVLGLAMRRAATDGLLPKIPERGLDGWDDFKGLRLSQAAEMVDLRIRSLLAMASRVFMGRIRQQGYNRFYNDRRFEKRRAANLIYHLASDNPRERFFSDPPDVPESSRPLVKELDRPSRTLRQVIDAAEAMPTTLWFDSADPLRSLIASGGATTCFNLLKYVARTAPVDPETGRFVGAAGVLWKTLADDWRRFNDDPRWLIPEQAIAAGWASRPPRS